MIGHRLQENQSNLYRPMSESDIHHKYVNVNILYTKCCKENSGNQEKQKLAHRTIIIEHFLLYLGASAAKNINIDRLHLVSVSVSRSKEIGSERKYTSVKIESNSTLRRQPMDVLEAL